MCIIIQLPEKHNITIKKLWETKKILFLSHFFKTLALKISGVNGGKIEIFISTYVEIYSEQGHIHFLIIHWEIRAADAKKYFFEGHTVDVWVVLGHFLSQYSTKTLGDKVMIKKKLFREF